MSVFAIKVTKGDILENAEIEYCQFGQTVKLTYRCGTERIEIEHAYPFFALKGIRRILESQGRLIICNGSRKDVYPSGNSAIGIMAYVLVLGQPATELVHIFNSVDDIQKISLVSEQESYRMEWLRSLGAGFRG